MNRYPVWKYAIIVIALLVGADLYPAQFLRRGARRCRCPPAKSTVKVDSTTQARVEQALNAAGIKPEPITLDATSVKVRA